MRLGLATIIAGMIPSLAACFTSAGNGDCLSDRDCGELVCTRVGDCASAGAVYALRIEWTVHGLTTDDAAACADVGELELAIEDPTTGDIHAVRPVPCEVGRFTFDKLPLSFTEVTLTAYDPAGELLERRRGSAVGAGGVVQLALLP